MGVTSTIAAGAANTVSRLADIGARQRARSRVLAAPLALALGALMLVYWATPQGLGVSPDSTQYLSAAQHFRNGDGLRVHWWSEGTEPLTHFPPGQVVALSSLESIGLTPDGSARLLNSIALVAIAILSFGLARKAANGSAMAGVAGAAAVVLARDVLTAHAMIWSEPLYLALMLGALLATARAIETDNTSAVVAAAILAGAAGLFRYVVPALIGAIALTLLLPDLTTLRRRIVRTSVFVGIASLPTLLLFAYNASRGPSAVNRDLVVHPPQAAQLMSAVRTAYYWVIPMRAPAWLELLVLGMLGIATMVLAVSLVRSGRATRGTVTADAGRVRRMLALVSLCYVTFLFAALTLVDAQSTPDQRLLLPALPPLAILVVAMLSDARRVPSLRAPAMAMIAAVSFAAASSVAIWVVHTRHSGLGYNSTYWRTSALIAAIRQLGPETIVYSNHPGAIFFQTGRETPGIPRLANPNTRQPNANWPSQMAAICERAAHQRIVYAHFSDAADWVLPSMWEVRRRLHSHPGLVTADGILDTVPAGCASHSAN